MEPDLLKSSKSMKHVVFVSPTRFPDDSASTRRILGIARTLQSIGHEITIVSGDGNNPQNLSTPSVDISCKCRALQELPPENAPKIYKALCRFVWGKKTLQWLKTLSPRPDAIFIYGGYTPYSRRLMPWARQHGIPLVNDVVEWFQPSHLPGGWFGPFHWNVEIALRYYYPKAKNIIAISRYLEDYYTKKNCHILRMPPTLDVLSAEARTTVTDGPVTLVYAGFPGKKDLIGEVIRAILRFDLEGKKVRLKMAGPSPEEILRMPALRELGMQQLPPCLEAMGRLSHDEVLELVREADYVPLLRRPQRYAMAGFPTKVPECMSLGTPVICNATSDLEDHIHDGQTGFLCPSYTADAFQNTLERVLALDVSQREAMRRAARAEAERAFDYRVFAEPMAQFLEQLQC